MLPEEETQYCNERGDLTFQMCLIQTLDPPSLFYLLHLYDQEELVEY